jgi:hypothetical protein
VVRPVILIVGEKQDEFHAPVKKSVAMMIFALGEEVDSWSHHVLSDEIEGSIRFPVEGGIMLLHS